MKEVGSTIRPVQVGDGARLASDLRRMELRPVRVLPIRPGELGPAEIATWHAMQRATPSLANPFLSPEFALAVGRFRPGAYVAVLTEGQFIAGFFPFERRRLGVGVPVCGWLTPCQGLIHAPEVEWDPRELLRRCGLSAWQFDNLIADQRPFRPYHAAIVPSPMIDLADGFDSYYAKLRVKSPHFCRELERRARKLEREVGELRIVADSRDTNVLRTLLNWKSDQYRRTSHVDRFECPGSSDSSMPYWPPAASISAVCSLSYTRETSPSPPNSACAPERPRRLVHRIRHALPQVLSRPDPAQTDGRGTRGRRDTHDRDGRGR